MPLAGLTHRSMARIVSRYLLHSASLWRFKGRTSDLEQWDSLGMYSARVTASGSTTHAQDSVAQQSDAEVLLAVPGGQGAAQPTFERNGRYRLKVTEYKSENEATNPNGPPEVKRVWWLETVRVEPVQDNAGTDFMVVLTCKNAKTWTEA